MTTLFYLVIVVGISLVVTMIFVVVCCGTARRARACVGGHGGRDMKATATTLRLSHLDGTGLFTCLIQNMQVDIQ